MPASDIGSNEAIVRYARANRERFLAELNELIAIPSISADPQSRGDVRRCAEVLVERMRGIGLERAEVLETDGNPIAYGEWLGAPGKPTVLIYGHYDVQPVDPLELWDSPPFAGTVRDGKLYGRGAVDDKGQVLMHLAAIESHLRVRGALPLNVKVLVEGEEEIGSPNFEAFLRTHRELLACDLAVISDTAVFAEDVPSLTTSLRGLVHWEVSVYGPSTDLHSGYFGGAVRNPIEALVQLLGVVEGRRRPRRGRRLLRRRARADRGRARGDRGAAVRRGSRGGARFGVPALAGEREYSPLERTWIRPTLELNGIYGGYQGPGAKTIIPSFARAKLSARLVPVQEPEHVKRVVRDHLLARAPGGVRVEVEMDGDVRAVETSRDHPAVAAAARAMERGFGKPPVFIGTGGTIGPVSSFDRILNLPQVLIGVGLPDDAIHAPNEKFDLAQFFGGIETMAHLYDELAAAPLQG